MGNGDEWRRSISKCGILGGVIKEMSKIDYVSGGLGSVDEGKINDIKAKTDLIPSSPATSTQVSTVSTDIRGTDSDTLKTISDQIDLLNVPTADNSGNTNVSYVVGNKTDTVAGTSLVAKIKQVIASLVRPTADSTNNVTPSDVIGNKTDTIAGTSLVALMKAVGADVVSINGKQNVMLDSVSYPKRKTATFSDTTGTVVLFNSVGHVTIKLHIRVKTTCTSAGGCNIRLGITGVTDAFIADTDITTLTSGKVWRKTTGHTSYDRYYDAVFEYDLAASQDIILTLSAQADGGVLEASCMWTGLSSDGNIITA